MDDEMIERCCRAAHDRAVKAGASVPKSYDDARITDEMKSGLKATILAVIKAMREPTDKMLTAGETAVEPGSSVVGCWSNMIDSIINE